MPWQSHAEFTAFMIEKSSVRMEDLRKTGFHRLDVQYESWRASGFKTPSGKIEFESARRSAAGLDPTPDFVAPSYGTRDDGFDLILFTGVRSMAYQNTRFREHAWARRLQDARGGEPAGLGQASDDGRADRSAAGRGHCPPAAWRANAHPPAFTGRKASCPGTLAIWR